MLLIYPWLFGENLTFWELNQRLRKPNLHKSEPDLDREGSPRLRNTINEEIRKIGQVYHLQRRFLL